MRFFTKMKRLSLMVAALLTAGTALAQEEYGVVWSQDFEDETTYSEGFKSGNEGRFSIAYSENGYKEGSHALSFSPIGNGHNGTTNTFTPTAELTNAFSTYKDEYQFDFYYYQQAGNNQNNSGLIINFVGGNKVNILAPASSSADVAVDDGASLGTIPNKTWCHIYIYTKDSQTKIKITSVDGGTEYVSETVITETSDYVSGISNPTKRYYGEFRFDDMTVSAPGASEGISAPSLSITKVDGINRTVTIESGVGTVGTEAESTYYTTDGTAPSKENGTKYTEPVVISATTTFNIISYLPDGTASEITTLEIEAGTTIALNKNIVAVTGLSGDNNAPVVSGVYTDDGVIGTPETVLTYTFNGETIELPYTVTEDGTLVATASAEGYDSTTETLNLYAAYERTEYIDFTTFTIDNLNEQLDGRWTLKEENMRWSNWGKGSPVENCYNLAELNTDLDGKLTDFLYSQYGTNMLIGYGVGRNVDTGSTSYNIISPTEGEIALYEVNKARVVALPDTYTENYVTYDESNKLTFTNVGNTVIAKVSVYTPVRELVIDDNETACVDFAPEYDKYSKITYNRELKTDYTYGLICLPFAPDAESLTNFQFYTLSSVADDAVTFVEEDAPVANTPYLYSIKEGATRTNTITGGETTVSTEVNNTTVGTWTLVGSLKNETIDCTADATTYNYIFNPAQNTLHRVKTTLTVYPYTAYLKNDVGGNQNSLSQMRVFIGTPTGIKEISRDQIEGFGDKAGMFDLQGRALSNPVKGQIYIENGEKKIKN